MNFRAIASPANAMDISSDELPASGVGAGGGALKVVPVTMTTASISKPMDNFDFFIGIFCSIFSRLITVILPH
jgi:hypothetical protein